MVDNTRGVNECVITRWRWCQWTQVVVFGHYMLRMGGKYKYVFMYMFI